MTRPPVPPAAPRSTVLVACLAFFVITLDTTVVNVALPGIGRQWDGQVAALQWVVTAYTLLFAALLLSAGAVSDRIGVALLGALIADSAHFMTGMRISLAVGAAVLVATTLGVALFLPGTPPPAAAPLTRGGSPAGALPPLRVSRAWRAAPAERVRGNRH
nr:hypothetical protein OH826_35850 [Streptomyces sp. NBC_00899]